MTENEKIEIEREHIKKWLQYFKENKLDPNDKQKLEELKDSIREIIKLEAKEMGHGDNFDIIFSDDERHNGYCYIEGTSWEDGEVKRKTPAIQFSTKTLYKNLDNENDKKRVEKTKEIFRDVFHELQHARQRLMVAQNVSSKDTLMYARDFCMMRHLNGFYAINYDNYFTENEANEVGYEQLLERLDEKDMHFLRSKEEETEKKNTLKYYLRAKSKDGQTLYTSFRRQEREDACVPVIDDFICEKKCLEDLQLYPVLQKEYNLDGTKKSIKELIENMESEIAEITQNTQLSEEEKNTLIQDGQEMYYGLIYNQLAKEPEQISEVVIGKGKAETQKILKDISDYFEKEKKDRLSKVVKLYDVGMQIGEYVDINDGIITVKQNGKTVSMNCDDFIKTLDPKLLQRNFTILDKDKEVEISAEQLVSRYMFRRLPSNGIVTLNDDTQISAKQYIEQYVLQVDELDKNHSPEKIIVDTMKLKRSWNKKYLHISNDLEKYYSAKHKVIKQTDDVISSFNPETSNEKTLKNKLHLKVRPSKRKVKIKRVKQHVTPKDIETATENCGMKEIKESIIEDKEIVQEKE